ncbi:MAG: ABC transporter substrate-binding protein [Gammaproteobacteria bacterium]|nr:ABC transporter substrate-binding protein [Gammaproteobacteria bacterium]MBQ0838216.1 ABC transporter substrate-binding protein [Gammaproteobacteria bacterium]
MLKAFCLMGALFFGLSACDQNSETTANSKAVESLDIVNIGRLICGGHLPLAIVEKKYQQQLKTFQLHTVQNHDWNDVVVDLSSGKLAGTFILSPLAMNLIREGFPGKIVLLADRNGNGFVLSKNIKSIDQLKSQRAIIAVPHLYSQHHVLLHELLKQHAIPTENIKVLGMPPRDMIHSLRSGEIDGFVVGEPEGNRSLSQGVGWMAAISPQIWQDHMDHVFLVSDTFINEQPEKLQELVQQLVRGGEFIENNPREAVVMGEDYTGAPAAVFEQVLSTPPDWISYSNMMVDDKDMISMAEKMVEMNLWPDVPDNLGSQYFNMSFVEKAVREK